jgi:uncharacterized damage-inducible protein DinB
MSMMGSQLGLIREGWGHHQRLLVAAIAPLSANDLAARTAPHQWTVWQLTGHLAGSRAHWFHDVLGEDDAATRAMFRMDRTTVPGLPLEDAGWEDDDEHPRSADELVVGLEATWAIIDDCLGRWTAEDLEVGFPRERPSGVVTSTRAWVIWHVAEHDVHHGGEISQILGTHGLDGLHL